MECAWPKENIHRECSRCNTKFSVFRRRPEVTWLQQKEASRQHKSSWSTIWKIESDELVLGEYYSGSPGMQNVTTSPAGVA